MSKSDEYRKQLQARGNWDDFLLKESGLPGPRGNIELAQVVADLGNLELYERYLGYDAVVAPTNSPCEFLAFCGVVGLGRLAAQGNYGILERLRGYSSDRRWRMREGVAMALQRIGEVNMDFLIREMEQWSKGSLLEQRAAAAALCEPKLLKQAQYARAVIHLLDQITVSLKTRDNRKSAEFLVLKKSLGYCWSVAVAALPAEGKIVMERWLVDPDKDVGWIMKENLKKARLLRVAPEWVVHWLSRIEAEH